MIQRLQALILAGILIFAVSLQGSHAADMSRILATGPSPICGLDHWERWENWDPVGSGFIRCPSNISKEECDRTLERARDLPKPAPRPIFTVCEHILVPFPPFAPNGRPVTDQDPLSDDEELMVDVIRTTFRFTEHSLPVPVMVPESEYLSGDCAGVVEENAKRFSQVNRGFGAIDTELIFSEKWKSCEERFSKRLVNEFPRNASVVQFDRLTTFLKEVDLSGSGRDKLTSYLRFMESQAEKIPLTEAIDKLLGG